MPRRERPLDAGESELLQFAADLRRLRELAGSPTYRELSRRAHYSAAALSEAAGGRKLPSLAVTLAYVQACEGDSAEWEARWRNALQHDMGLDGQSPYVGLKPFQAADAHRFFGRDRLTSELLDLVTERRFIGVFGASGVGKSSVLRAGLIARTDLPVMLFTPGADPLDEVAMQLATVRDESVKALRAELEDDPANLKRLADGLLVVVDQFEELFTLCRDNRQREWLITALTSGPHVVIGVRADFYGHCARYPRLVDALRGGQVMVGAMSADELRQAVTEPAHHAGAKVEAALLARLMSDAVGQASVLPLLSHALAETWVRRDGMTLTLAGYEQAGGLEHAVTQTAHDVYTSLGTAQRKEAREILLRLIAVGDGTDDTKRKVRLGEVSASEVLDKLVAARLLTLDGDGVELAHEALIRSWPLLREWIGQDRDGLRVHRRLTDAADAWESLGRDPGALYRGVRLEVALEWRAHSHTALNERERAFLAASEAAEEEVRTAVRKRTRRGRYLIAVLVVLLAVALTSTVVALNAQRSANEERNNALALKAVGEAAALRTTNPALAIQLSLAAYQLAGVPDALRGLRYDAFTGQQLRQSGSEVTAMVLTPVQQLLSGHRDGTVLFTDLRDQPGPREPVRMTKHEGAVVAMAISADGRTVVTAGEDGYVHIIDVSLGRPSEIGTFQAHAGPVTAMAFRRDTLVTAGQDSLVKMWDGVRNASQKLVRTHADVLPKLRHVAFSDDGNRMVAVTVGGDAIVLDVGGGGELYPRATLPQAATTASFNQHGDIVTAGGQVATVWDQTRLGQRKNGDIPGEGGQITAAIYSHDGKTVATANEDGTTRLWSLPASGAPIETVRLSGHAGAVTTVALMPDSDTVVTGGADGTLRLWEIGGRDRYDRACERAVPRMTEEDWNRYFPGVEFKPPCPSQ
ncbi:hypothetical protein FKR81_12225 [Lentzea tibetensis]|uniref:HTH cro/C1-type domain-containing protein n=1 Tax=Lentzea tibetensis TaxID=2591470 RepID=A0A563EXE4_9PSEU|nr:hypothetical protein [Lentzea tibetensis]TWP52323.1 hypothetical protein FKR81_12225 [Lentzea tibetensis]